MWNCTSKSIQISVAQLLSPRLHTAFYYELVHDDQRIHSYRLWCYFLELGFSGSLFWRWKMLNLNSWTRKWANKNRILENVIFEMKKMCLLLIFWTSVKTAWEKHASHHQSTNRHEFISKIRSVGLIWYNFNSVSEIVKNFVSGIRDFIRPKIELFKLNIRKYQAVLRVHQTFFNTFFFVRG